jgi:hypothetical protein
MSDLRPEPGLRRPDLRLPDDLRRALLDARHEDRDPHGRGDRGDRHGDDAQSHQRRERELGVRRGDHHAGPAPEGVRVAVRLAQALCQVLAVQPVADGDDGDLAQHHHRADGQEQEDARTSSRPRLLT